MKRISFIIPLFLTTVLSAQISTITVAEKKQNYHVVEELVFDSTKNCPRSNFSLLVGQEVYVLPREKADKSKGFAGFKTLKFNVKSDKESVKRYGTAAPDDKTRTKSEELENKVFCVTDFEQSESQYPTYCLTLTEKNNSSNVCKYIFKYESNFNHTFATMKHYAYLKEQCVGKKFYFAKCCLPENDSNTGERLKDRNSHSWTCKDIIISPESGRLTMLLEYQGSQTYLKEYESSYVRATSMASFIKGETADGTTNCIIIAYTEDAWNQNIERYGEEMMWLALNHKVAIGMPYELLKKSIGMPKDSEVASYGTQLYYKVDMKDLVRNGVIPFMYYQNQKSEIYIYLDENNIVTGWN